MADIPSLRIGDTLKVPYTIEALIQDPPSNRPVRVDEGLWLRRELVEAAEHIPAPRVFKRGDWVRRVGGMEWPQGRGLVVGIVPDDPGSVYVSFESNPASGYRCYAGGLEPDEATE